MGADFPGVGWRVHQPRRGVGSKGVRTAHTSAEIQSVRQWIEHKGINLMAHDTREQRDPGLLKMILCIANKCPSLSLPLEQAAESLWSCHEFWQTPESRNNSPRFLGAFRLLLWFPSCYCGSQRRLESRLPAGCRPAFPRFHLHPRQTRLGVSA